MLVWLELAEAIVALGVQLHPERKRLARLGFASGLERIVEPALSYGFVLPVPCADPALTLAFALLPCSLKRRKDLSSASVEAGDHSQAFPSTELVVLIGADGDRESSVKHRQQFADAVFDLHPAEAFDVLNQQNRACGVFGRVIDEPVEAVLLSPRRMDCLRLKQLVFRMLLQPLISGLLLSWELLPLR